MHYIAPSVEESTYFDFFASHRAARVIARDPRVAGMLTDPPQYSALFGSALLRLRGGATLDVADSSHGVTVRVFVGGVEVEDERTAIEPVMDDPFRRDAFIVHRLRRIIASHAAEAE